jgi:hypothetical protein
VRASATIVAPVAAAIVAAAGPASTQEGGISRIPWRGPAELIAIGNPGAA